MSSDPKGPHLSAEGYTVESYVRQEMDERDWSLKDLARHSGLSVERLGQFLHLGMWGDDIAPALEMAFGVNAQTWSNLWIADVGRELDRQAQATEIAALKGALKALDLAHRRIRVHRRAQGGCGCWYDDGDSNRGWVADENCEFARVLAGKGAQGA